MTETIAQLAHQGCPNSPLGRNRQPQRLADIRQCRPSDGAVKQRNSLSCNPSHNRVMQARVLLTPSSRAGKCAAYNASERSGRGSRQTREIHVADMMLTATVDEMLENSVATGSGMYTGRQIVTFKPGTDSAAIRSLAAGPGMRVASAADFEDHVVDFSALGDAATLVFPELNVAVVATPMAADPAFVRVAPAADPDSPILAIEPETFVFPCADEWQEYLRGFAAAPTASPMTLPAREPPLHGLQRRCSRKPREWRPRGG
jgi:hypothetical protein